LIPKLKEWSRVLSNEVGDGANFLVMNANAILKRVATNRVGRQYQKGANSTGRGRGGGGQATAKRSLERQNIEEMKESISSANSPARVAASRRFASPILLSGQSDFSASARGGGGEIGWKTSGERNVEDGDEIMMLNDEHFNNDDSELNSHELKAIESELYGNNDMQRKDHNGHDTKVSSSSNNNNSSSSSSNNIPQRKQVSPPRATLVKQEQEDGQDRSPSRSPVPHIYDNVEDAENYLVGQAIKKSPAIRSVTRASDTSSTAVQSPERSTDDLLAFYNRLISKARALHEDENEIDQDEEDELFEEFSGSSLR
jgi:hypothetical protein